jgi:K+-sensing histidine kinase KdpD
MTEITENALKYSPEHTPVIINGRECDGIYIFKIIDYGCGMKMSDIKSLSAFKKCDENFMSDSGLGLGLSIVMLILKYCTGNILFESTPGVYTMVTVQIPVADEKLKNNKKLKYNICS